MERIQELKNKLTDKWKELSRLKQISFTLALLSVIIVILISTYMLNKTDYSTLFSDLTDEESGNITKVLEENEIKYKLEEKGSKVLVESSQIDKVRIDLAVENKLPNKSTGFEIFDEKNMMATDEDRKIMYQRAVVGELQRSIESLSAVKQAKVMLVTPDKSIFEEKNKESTASIVLKLQKDQALSEETVKGIASLTSGAVENLPQKNIKIVDEQGNVLSDILDDKKMSGVSDLTTKYQKLKDDLEEKLEGKTKSLLGSLFEKDALNLAVNVDLDFDSIEKTTVKYDKPKVRSEVIQAGGDTINQQQVDDGTVKDNVANVIGNNENGTKSYNHTINNELDTETTKILNAPGVVKRVTASVLIKENISNQETRQIEELVQSAIGYERERGDKVSVQAIKFAEDEQVNPVEELSDESFFKRYLTSPIVWGVLAGILLLVITLIILVVKRRSKDKDSDDYFEMDLDVTEDFEEEAQPILEQQPIIPIKPEPKEKAVSKEIDQVVKNIEENHQRIIQDDLANELEQREKQKAQEILEREVQAKRYAKENPDLAAELIKVWMKDK
ncbi:flagellar basal-body MS-ring/collar protein FliF [Vagococcus carniphilus]|uniref:flagellar basal-body MS-ring/collar protein FliF n=1 Tax=Vagococcus carniphilus TaxID=218144 RepID=UPI002891A480|nr:flagellar basal-body MS-ring/collar protein FliF [Vagococcus carniphilus]MDT2815878.1 flagellar basal-body MS-ring/collar protein FliF [Vagococcus carniphilus]MDT2829611.1 flagellar basal-body MS-ring/collar protein FliF [Vagococcus carniphilus]MDT2839070.1 flagellar basal-body MS-ring/collar protein FliF [Vagococcus carniphilus]MDT2853128.1 flagellar basal-body MS-ring/collar protein FliF [Vagococcus carniphilus]MDT2865099.1 flagellar basal-body MS-ring/collar protein FliF [Vagococcus carn